MNNKVARQLLLEQAGIFDSLGLPFFLIQGTALGAYRDSGFTPTERDIDFGFLQEHFTPKSDRLAIALEQAGYEVTRCARPFRQVRTIKAKKNGINTDLVSYMKWQNKRFTHNTDPKTRPYAIVHDAALLETYDTVSLFGRTFKVPSPIETYLHREYDDWRTPREDSVSRTRDYDFMKEQNVPESLIDSPYFKCSTPIERLDQQHRDQYWWYLTSHQFHEKFLKTIGESCIGHVLDVECGVGALSEHIHDYDDYTGVDTSPAAISFARTRYPHREFHVCQFDRFPDDPPIGKEQYDTIVFGNILDVVVKPEQRLALVEKYLRFRPSRIIIYDLERLDVTPFNHRFGHPTVKAGSVSLPIDEVKRHRKILVYET